MWSSHQKPFPQLQLFNGFLISRGFQGASQGHETGGSENEIRRKGGWYLDERERQETEKEEKALGANKGRRQRGHIRNSDHMGGGVGVGR